METGNERKNTEPHGFKAETNYLKVKRLARLHIMTELTTFIFVDLYQC